MYACVHASFVFLCVQAGPAGSFVLAKNLASLMIMVSVCASACRWVDVCMYVVVVGG